MSTFRRTLPDPESEREQVEHLVFECLEAQDVEAAFAEVERWHAHLAPRVRAALAEVDDLSLGTESATDYSAPKSIGPFELIRQLGTGGMGVVYAAHDRELDREVAVKRIRSDQLDVEESRQRFQREVAAVARLQHPGIVAIYSAGEEDGQPYYSMELVAGASLAQRLKEVRGRPFAALSGADLLGEGGATNFATLPASGTSSRRITTSWIETSVRLAGMVAAALEHAHQRGVVHRDVKPSNVLVDAHGQARLLDFGLAHLKEGQELTRSNAQLGSLPYMPPEVIEGRLAEYGPAQDVYSLGVTLYELITLESPFLGPTAGETRRRIVAAQPVRPRTVYPQISWDVETVCLKAMDPDPRRRYESAGDFAADLTRILARESIHARRPGPMLRLRRRVQRHPAWSVGLVLGAIGTAGVIWFAIYAGLQARTEAGLRVDAEATADALAKRNEQYDMLAHAVELNTLRQGVKELPGWPDRAESLRAWLSDEWQPLRAVLPEMQSALVALSRSVDPETGRFPTTVDQFLHETLTQLVKEIDAFESGTVAKLRARLEWSERVEGLSYENPGARCTWAEARDAIRAADGVLASDLYAATPEFELVPQLGLTPIGRNPATQLWEFYHLRSATDPTVVPSHDPETGVIEVDEGTGIIFALVPGGSFAMGAQGDQENERNYDKLAQPQESPVDDVRLDPYLLARHELTQGQWERLGEANPSVYGPGDWQFRAAQPVTLAHPVENISWHEARTLLHGHGLALPTEAQWEYACRAGTDTPWWTGREKEKLRGAVNLCDSLVRRVKAPWPEPEVWLDDGYVVHAPVATLRTNAWGMHHMLGNVWEWCEDATLLYKTAAEPGTGLRRVDRPTSSRTQRGGSCTNPAKWARCAMRSPAPPGTKNGYLGVRPMRSLKGAN